MSIRSMLVPLPVFAGFISGCQALQTMLPERTQTPPAATAGLPDANWRQPAQLQLSIGEGGRRASRIWTFQFGEGQELLITPVNKTPHGRILLLDSYTMLVEHGVADPGNAVATVDRPALDKELALKLLSLAWPYNPLAVRQERIRLLSVDQAMLISAGSDEESYIGPWDLTGRLRKRDQWRVDFELEFRSPKLRKRGSTRTVRLQGKWQGGPRQALAPTMPVRGWHVYEFVPTTRLSGGVAIASFQAELVSVQFASLAEARRYARQRH